MGDYLATIDKGRKVVPLSVGRRWVRSLCELAPG